MTLPDQRIRFPATLIDFINDVGLSGNDHDNYPPAGGQARYDHMRMFLVGLLSQQASYEEPTEYRNGTPWFDLQEGILKIRFNGSWVPYSQCISVEQDNNGNNTKTLAEFYTEIADSLTGLSPEITYSGSAEANGVTTIPIPESLRQYIFSDSRATVYIDGILINPQLTVIDGSSTSIILSGVSLSTGETFTVFIKRIPDSTFYTQSVTAI